MPFCTNCGKELSDGEKFCPNCGAATGVADNSKRTSVYDGELHKCPNCGEILKSFEINCPACGYELRSVKASSAVKEFASKLEAIEARREYEKPRGLFARAEALQRVSKADEQKISLIKSFAVPNSKEDILEFMILATSSINLNAYDNTSGTVTKSDKELNAAWLAKVEQVFEKARRSFSTDNTFGEIEYLYKKCQEAIKKKKKKVLIKWILMVGWIPLAWIILIAGLLISGPKDEAAELDRLDTATATLNFQVFRQCDGQLTPVPASGIWTFSRTVATAVEANSFGFAFCDCDNCNCGCCNYSVVATVVGAATTGTVTLNNATLIATVVEDADC